MPNWVAISLMVSDKKIFKDFEIFLVLLPLTRVFELIKFFQEILKRNISAKFHRNPISSFRAEDIQNKS